MSNFEINYLNSMQDFNMMLVTPITKPIICDLKSWYLEPTHFVTRFIIHEYEDVIHKIEYISCIMNFELNTNPNNRFKINASIVDDNTLDYINFVFRIMQTEARDFLIVEIQRTNGCAMMFNTVYNNIRNLFEDKPITVHKVVPRNQDAQSDDILNEWNIITQYLETEPIEGLRIIGVLGFQGVKIPKSIIDLVLSDYSDDIRTNRYVMQIMIAYASDPTSDFTGLSIPVLRLFHEITRFQGNIKERYACKMISMIAKNHREVLINKDEVPYVGLVDSLRRIMTESTWPDTCITTEYALEALVSPCQSV